MLRSNRKNVLRWSHLTKQREFFDEIGEKLGVLNWEDWYKVTKQQVISLGGEGDRFF